MTNTPPTAKQATRNLATALINMASRGLRTPCSDLAIRDYWVSELELERRQAARWCVEWDCPVIEPCLTAGIANDELVGLRRQRLRSTWGQETPPRQRSSLTHGEVAGT
jgi:hypothetical protein